MRRRIVIVGVGLLLLAAFAVSGGSNPEVSSDIVLPPDGSQSASGVNGEKPNTSSPQQMPQPAESANRSTGLQLYKWSTNCGGNLRAYSTNYRSGVSVGQSAAGKATGQTIIARLGFWYCDCGAKGDVNGDSRGNPVDVVYLVNCVYKAQCALVEPANCPFPVGDLNCGGDVNPIDVVILVNFVYKQQDAICYGCGQ